jgi:hypothetical protein
LIFHLKANEVDMLHRYRAGGRWWSRDRKENLLVRVNLIRMILIYM